MKVSLNWVKELTEVDLGINELVDKIGSQLGAIDSVTDLGERYKGILIVQVISCIAHPKADKLKVCLIDDDGAAKAVERDANGYVSVVCGAPNVAEGQLVAWLPPGVTVPVTFDKDPLKMEARVIREVKSNGVLASASELAIGDDHNGLLILDQGKPGDLLADVYKLNDYIIDIENKMLTHRPDCFGMLGIAREISGVLGQAFRSPDWYMNVMASALQKSAAVELPLVVENQLSDLVPRFIAVALSNVELGLSPVLIRSYLSRLGIKPINNIVDVTNYMMLLTAQPLHVYDYDKVKNLDPEAMQASLVVRYPKNGEKLTLLNGKEVSPPEKTILISTQTKAIGIGGVIGGTETEVDENTKNIILECATFDMYSIRRTSMALGIFTDAVTRYTKGQSPLQNDRITAKSILSLNELSGGQVASEMQDVSSELKQPADLDVSVDFINSRLGMQLEPIKMQQLLQNVEFKAEVNTSELHIGIPFWRTDIEIKEDVVEEVGRLYGYDHLTLSLPKKSLLPANRSPHLELHTKIRHALAAAGANEVLTYTFIHGDLIKKVGQDSSKAEQLSNALSPDLQFYRMSLLPSLLDKVNPNLRSDVVRSDDNDFVLFEINKVLNKVDKDEENLPKEIHEVALVVAADKKTSQRKYGGAPYYMAKKYLLTLLEFIHIDPDSLTYIPLESSDLTSSTWLQETAKPYETKRAAAIISSDNNVVGVVGEFRSTVKQSLKLPEFSAGFDIDSAYFLATQNKSLYKALPKFPKVVQDLSLKTSVAVSYKELLDLVTSSIDSLKPDNTTYKLIPLDIYQRAEDQEHFQVTFRLWISAYDRTLKTEEVNELLDKVAQITKEKLAAERISSTPETANDVAKAIDSSL